MNPARSPTTTGSLPSRRARATASSTTDGSVTTVRTTSTSRCTGAGLKKCSPTTRPGSRVDAAISATDRLEVFVARIAAGSHDRVEPAEDLALEVQPFRDGLDHELRGGQVVERGGEADRGPSSCLRSSPASLPRATARDVERSTSARPCSTRAASASTATTSRPDAGQYLGDARAHRPQPDDPDRPDLARHAPSLSGALAAPAGSREVRPHGRASPRPRRAQSRASIDGRAALRAQCGWSGASG